jgi:hypothetical protein
MTASACTCPATLAAFHFIRENPRNDTTPRTTTLPRATTVRSLAIRALAEAYAEESLCDVRRRGCMVVNAAVELMARDPQTARRVEASWDTLETAAQRQRLQRGVERIRTRQRDGELTGTVSPGFVMLLAHMITFAPVAMPQIVQDILGIDPHSPNYRQLCSKELAALLESRSGPGIGRTG